MLLQIKLKTQINNIRGFDIQSPLCNELKSWYRLIVCHLMRYVIKHKNSLLARGCGFEPLFQPFNADGAHGEIRTLDSQLMVIKIRFELISFPILNQYKD